MTKNNFRVDVSPEMRLYKILQRQAYGIETALAEFVDNSIQSFRDKQDAIKAIDGPKPKLKVRIVISSSDKRIMIEDNAAGINRADFQRAIRMGNDEHRTPQSESLSVYGIGMKSSAIWFSNRWTIETSSLGSVEKLTTTFDLDQLLASGNTQIEVETTPEDVNEHYTRITINDCLRDLGDQNNRFADSVLPYLQETFFRFKNVFIEIEHDRLVLTTKKAELKVPEPLVYPRVNKEGDPLSKKPVVWKKTLRFTHDKKPVTGFIMIRETGSYRGPGIRLLRNDRVIVGTQGGGRQNKPEVLIGTRNKFAAQRIYGEVKLNDFPVNFMKTGFDIDLESLYRAIKTEISARPPDVEEDYIDQASFFRKNKVKGGGKKKPKKKGKPRRAPSSKEIPFSQDLNDALEKLPIKKLFRLYRSLCNVSLIEDPVLAYVGAWTLLESLATQMGKETKTSFSAFFNQEINQIVTDKGKRADYKNVIEDIGKKGNMNKHSASYESMDARQLVSDFPTIEEFLIHCAENVAARTP